MHWGKYKWNGHCFTYLGLCVSVGNSDYESFFSVWYLKQRREDDDNIKKMITYFNIIKNFFFNISTIERIPMQQ